MLDNVTAARSLMGLSLSFHIIFTALGIGIPFFFLLAEVLAQRTGNDVYLLMARRWGAVTAVLFAVGAVSGTILSFEFGLLWPTFMDFSGPIIGLPFGLEGFAFFTEAIFLAIYLYAWNKLSPRMRIFSALVISISSAGSAFFVISANSWMNQPVGFEIINGKATAIDPLRAIFNPAMPYEVIHGTLASYVATGFAVAAIYAVKMLRGDRSEYVKKGLMLGMAVGAIAVPLQIASGDFSARFVAHRQPAKFAAMEAIFDTESGAALNIGGIVDPNAKTLRYAVRIPRLTSLLAFEDPNAEIKGLNSFPQDEIPNVFLVHYPFDIMVGIGFFLLFVGGWFWLFAWRRKRIDPGGWLLRTVAATFPLGFIAIIMGWYVTEFGRQPWIIWHIMRTADAATPADGIFYVFLVFMIIYVALAAGLGILLYRVAPRRLSVTGDDAAPGRGP